MNQLYEYKIWYHGVFVGFAIAMTKSEAIQQFHNKNSKVNLSGLTATENIRVYN